LHWEQFDDGYPEYVSGMRRLIQRVQASRDSTSCLFGSELHGEGKHLRTRGKVVL